MRPELLHGNDLKEDLGLTVAFDFDLMYIYSIEILFDSNRNVPVSQLNTLLLSSLLL